MQPLIEKMGLPVVKIHETDFFLYGPGLLFQQVDNRDNQIFFTQLKDQGEHTLLLFDTRTQNAYTGTSEEFILPTHVIEVRLPALRTLMGPVLTDVTKLVKDSLLKKKPGKSDETINQLKNKGRKR